MVGPHPKKTVNKKVVVDAGALTQLKKAFCHLAFSAADGAGARLWRN